MVYQHLPDSIPLDRGNDKELPIINLIETEMEKGFRVEDDIKVAVGRCGENWANIVPDNALARSAIQNVVDYFIRQQKLGRLVNELQEQNRVFPSDKLYKLLSGSNTISTVSPSAANSAGSLSRFPTVQANWRSLKPSEVAELAQACKKGFRNGRTDAHAALRQIDVELGDIPNSDVDREYYVHIIQHLSPRDALLEKWLLALARNPDDPEKWSGFHFAIEWLNKLSLSSTGAELTQTQLAEIKTTRERFLRPKDDILKDVDWLLRGYQAANCVAKLEDKKGSATGFLIAPDLLLTNHHVMARAEDVARFTAQFDFYKDSQGNIHTSPGTLDPKIFYSDYSYRGNVDFTIVGIQTVGKRAIPRLAPDTNLEAGQPVYILQHPKGQTMQITINNNVIQGVTDEMIYHSAPTDRGSSGSPIFNKNWEVIGVHWGDAGLNENRQEANGGTRIGKILEIVKEIARKGEPNARTICKRLEIEYV